jgi:hypothetical protein
MQKCFFCLCIVLCADVARGTDVDAVGGLKAALGKNVQHAERWLEERDYKSLGQSAGGLKLLAELLKAKSDDAAWQAAMADVATKIGELQAAAPSEDVGQCKAALDALQKSLTIAEKMSPAGKRAMPPKAPALRPLMLTMDAIQADAKVAILTGNVVSAKQQAAVLAELSNFVAGARKDAQWDTLADDFAKACTAAAVSAETDPKAVRQLLRGVAERCDACHENARTRP